MRSLFSVRLIVVQKIVDCPILVITQNRAKINVPDTIEDILLYIRVFCRQLLDQFLDKSAFRPCAPALDGAGLSKAAGALNKMQIIVTAPCLDIRLSADCHVAMIRNSIPPLHPSG